MRNRILMAILGLTLIAAKPEEKAPQVQVVGVIETRAYGALQVISSGQRDPELDVVLRVTGLDQPARSGRVVVREATDDAGTDLAPSSSDSGQELEFPTAVKRIDSAVYETLPAIDVRVKLRASDRKARRIASLKGEVHLMTGSKEFARIKIPGIKALLGKTVDNPDLAKAGVTLQVSQVGRLDPTELTVILSGKLPRDSTVAVVDRNGAGIWAGAGGSSNGAADCKTLTLKRPLEASDALVVALPLEQKAVTIPFDLKDVELP